MYGVLAIRFPAATILWIPACVPLVGPDWVELGSVVPVAGVVTWVGAAWWVCTEPIGTPPVTWTALPGAAARSCGTTGRAVAGTVAASVISGCSVGPGPRPIALRVASPTTPLACRPCVAWN